MKENLNFLTKYKKRSKRRYNNFLMKKRAYNKKVKLWNYNDTYTIQEIKKNVGILSKTRTTCSCFMCKNERKIFGKKTLSENKCLISLKEWNEDLI